MDDQTSHTVAISTESCPRTSLQGEQSSTSPLNHQTSQTTVATAARRHTRDPTTSNHRRTISGDSTALLRRATTLFKPEKPLAPPPNFLQSIKAIIFASWFNVLLIFIPVSWVLYFIPESALGSNKDTLVFVFSFLAIMPLAKLLAFATDELSLRVGQVLAGLLNATLGNAVELIVAIIALVHCELSIVQSSLVGSVLSNLLLVLGMCFFAGGLRFSEQGFGVSATQLNSSLLTISVIAVLLPAAFSLSVDQQTDADEGSDILKVSRGVAIILLFIYASYLVFQLYSHVGLYDDESDDVQKSRPYTEEQKENFRKLMHKKGTTTAVDPNGGSNANTITSRAATASPIPHPSHDVEAHHEENKEEGEQPQMSLSVCITLLVVVTVFVAVTAEWLVDSIDGMTESGGISKEFVGIILLPIVGNAAEHVTAVTVSVKDKLTLSLNVAAGSSIQIALFVIPFIVTLGWILGKPMTLLFDPLQSVTMFLAVLTVNYVVQDGKSNWLEGMILMCLYVILAVTFWFYPGSDPSGLLDQCT